MTSSAARQVGDDALTEAMTRLRRDRSRALASPSRAADSLALEALLGTGVDPFGDGSDVERADVEAFLADHYGSGRALLIVVGDVPRDTLRETAMTAFASLEDPRSSRAEREGPNRGVRVEVGNASSASLATLFATPEAAAHASRRWVARVDSPGASADVFPLRGGTAVIVRGPGPLGPLVDRLSELRAEPLEGVTLHAPDDPSRLARWHGARWASTGTERAGGLGVGALIDGGRGDDVDVEDPDVAVRARASAELEAELGWEPGLDGDIDDDHADVRLENGTRLLARRIRGAEIVAIAALFEGGAVEEAPRQHGLTALLAAVSERTCVQRATRELGVHPDTLGIVIRSVVRSERTGLLISGPRDRWAELTYLAGRCARAPRLEPSEVDTTRALLRREQPEVAALARLVSPDAPGRITPMSSDPPSADAPALLRWRDRVAVGRRARYALVGDLPIERAVARLARIVGRHPEGSRAEATPWGGPPEGPLAFSGAATLGAWVVWSAASPAQADLAPPTFADHAARTLGARPGLRVLENRSGHVGGRAWAAVRVGLDEATLARLPELVAIEGDWASLAAAAVAGARDTSAWRSASAEASATALASAPNPLEEGAARSLFQRLAASEAHLVVLRPAH